MEARILILICFLAAAAQADNLLVEERPSLQVAVSQTANLKCCYKSTENLDVKWSVTVMITHNTSNTSTVNYDAQVDAYPEPKETDKNCNSLVIKNVRLNDTGLYRCILNHSSLPKARTTPGTFLHVYVPIKKTLNLSEEMKNSIITAEGVLLLLCVLIPGTMLLCKSKGLHELEKRNGKEEENIYEGLNLDDCTSTYHQIQRSQVQGPYHDVGNTVEEDIQFEKP